MLNICTQIAFTMPEAPAKELILATRLQDANSDGVNVRQLSGI